MSQEAEQQHPLGVYFWVWGLLFVLSFFSYMVDFYQLQGMLRWSLILIFMVLKAGYIVWIFMHMKWERLSLIYAVLTPPIGVLIFMILMIAESSYTVNTRGAFFTAAF